jgi:hypothetical protein
MPIEANLSQILARRVVAAAAIGDWPLVKSLADVLINLQERDLVTEAGRAAWAAGSCARCGRTDCQHIPAALTERVREVPLINPPMRIDKPRRCSAESGTAQCQLAAGHDGGHGYRSPTGAVAAWD